MDSDKKMISLIAKKNRQKANKKTLSYTKWRATPEEERGHSMRQSKNEPIKLRERNKKTWGHR